MGSQSAALALLARNINRLWGVELEGGFEIIK